MDDKQQLIDMIVSKNLEVIEANNVVLDASSLVLTLPSAGDFNGSNTVVMATAVHDKVEGDQVFYYNRLTEMLFREALGNPEILIPKDISTLLQLKDYLAVTFNVMLDLDHVKSAQRQQSQWVLKFWDWSYTWLGTFSLDAEIDPDNPILTPLTDILTKTRLDGLYYPDNG
jgi:hypothetical protein